MGQQPTSVGRDMSLALLEQAGLAAYERDPLANNFFLWLTSANGFAGGELPRSTAAVELGTSSEDSFRSYIHANDIENFSHVLERALKSDGTYRFDYRLMLKNGAVVWVQDSGRIEYASSGLPLRARGVIACLEPYIVRAEQAEFAASFDKLTGRPNRHELERQIDSAIAAGVSGSLHIVSIDNMTWINEAIGPSAANDLLLATTQRIARLVPEDTVIARTGGDSFGVWLPHHTDGEADEIAATILKSFRDQHFATLQSAVHITVSVGGVTIPANAQNGIEAITRAEQALKTGRQIGRSSYRIYEASEDRRANHLVTLSEIEQLRKALAEGRLLLAYQPIVSSMSGEVMFFEALLRMKQSDDNGDDIYISTANFIRALELHGLAQEIDRYVIGLSIETLVANPSLTLSINVSGATASDSSFHDFLEQKLSANGDVGRRMILEITETAAIKDLEITRNFVQLIHKFGGKAALDDFGEGFTALQHLRHLEVNYLKIDGGLIKDIDKNGAHQVMVKAILSMAQHMNMQTVAEFVETEGEAAWLRRHGANLLQGYFFNHPMIELPNDIKHITNESAEQFLANSGYLTLSI